MRHYNSVDYSRVKYILLATSLAWGVLAYASPGTAFFIAILCAIATVIYMASERSERRFLLWLLFAGVAARVLLMLILIVIVYLRPGIEFIWGDGLHLSNRGAQMVMFWVQSSPEAAGLFGDLPEGFPYFMPDTSWEDDLFEPYAWTWYIYVLGAFYLLFGYSPFAAKFINVLAGVSAPVLFYYALKRSLNERTARLAAVFIMFFPTLLLWSVTNMKDSVFTFLTAVYILALVNLVNKFKLRYAVLFAVALIIQTGIRTPIGNAITFLLLFAYFAACRLGLAKKGFVVILVLLFIVLSPVGKRAIQSNSRRPFKLLSYHIGHINTPGTVYKILDEKYYHAQNSLQQMSYREFGATFARAWFHFLAEPLPVRLKTRLQLAAFPLMLTWYLLLPFFIIGFLQVLFRYSSRGIWAMAIYFLIFSSLIAITGGNVGTLIRQRDMVSPFFLMFAASAIVNTLSLPKAEARHLQHSHTIS